MQAFIQRLCVSFLTQEIRCWGPPGVDDGYRIHGYHRQPVLIFLVPVSAQYLEVLMMVMILMLLTGQLSWPAWVTLEVKPSYIQVSLHDTNMYHRVDLRPLVPPYVPAVVFTVIVAIASDKFKWRGPFILIFLPITIGGK